MFISPGRRRIIPQSDPMRFKTRTVNPTGYLVTIAIVAPPASSEQFFFSSGFQLSGSEVASSGTLTF